MIKIDVYYGGEWRLRTTLEGYEIKCPQCGQTNTHENLECKDCQHPLVSVAQELIGPQE